MAIIILFLTYFKFIIINSSPINLGGRGLGLISGGKRTIPGSMLGIFFMEVLQGLHSVHGIEPRSDSCKANNLPTVISLWLNSICVVTKEIILYFLRAD